MPAAAVVEANGFSSAGDGLTLGQSLRDRGANTEAFAVFAAAHRRYPRDSRLLSAYGRQALRMGEEALAARLLRQAIEADPNDWRALSAHAVLEGRQGRNANARIAFVQAQSLSADDPVVLNNLGISYLLDGNAERAAALFRQALLSLKLNRMKAARIRRNLAVALAVSGDFATAERLAARSLPRHLRNAGGDVIARFMGLSGHPFFDSGGWRARLADAT
jgi:Flp pilus assembly protein TadD